MSKNGPILVQIEDDGYYCDNCYYHRHKGCGDLISDYPCGNTKTIIINLKPFLHKWHQILKIKK